MTEITNPPAEKKKSDWREGQHPLSVRVKDKSKVAFLDGLITEKGNQQAALDHCITLAMNNSPADSGVAKELNIELREAIKKLNAAAVANAEQLRQMKAKDEEISRLKEKPEGGIQLSNEDLRMLDKIEKSKKVSRDKAISHSINYTYKNDWL